MRATRGTKIAVSVRGSFSSNSRGPISKRWHNRLFSFPSLLSSFFSSDFDRHEDDEIFAGRRVKMPRNKVRPLPAFTRSELTLGYTRELPLPVDLSLLALSLLSRSLSRFPQSYETFCSPSGLTRGPEISPLANRAADRRRPKFQWLLTRIRAVFVSLFGLPARSENEMNLCNDAGTMTWLYSARFFVRHPERSQRPLGTYERIYT